MAGARAARAPRPRTPARCWSSGSRSIRTMRATPARWLDAGAAAARCCAHADAEGFARADGWTPGAAVTPPPMPRAGPASPDALTPILDRAMRRARPRASATSSRCSRRAATSFDAVCAAADALRAATSAASASATSSPATSTTPTSATTAAGSAPSPRASSREHLRGRPYDLAARRDRAPLPRGLGARRHRSLPAGRHPSATTPATTYLAICRAIKAARAGPARPCLLAARSARRARRRSALRVAGFSRPSCKAPGSARCPAPRRKSSTTRFAP